MGDMGKHNPRKANTIRNIVNPTIEQSHRLVALNRHSLCAIKPLSELDRKVAVVYGSLSEEGPVSLFQEAPHLGARHVDRASSHVDVGLSVERMV